jgi:DNA-binding NarL/FixJ family response regulator
VSTGATGATGATVLSARQVEILRLAADGLTNAQIAGQLYLSVATVERHCTIAYRTLGVRNRAQALGVLARSSASGRRPPGLSVS